MVSFASSVCLLNPPPEMSLLTVGGDKCLSFTLHPRLCLAISNVLSFLFNPPHTLRDGGIIIAMLQQRSQLTCIVSRGILELFYHSELHKSIPRA